MSWIKGIFDFFCSERLTLDERDMSDGTTKESISDYQLVGGAEGVRALVERFYQIMDETPAYRALREMHAADLGAACEDLIGFLGVWLGGPRVWLERRGGFCLMSRHASMGIGANTAGQWLAAMREALDGTIQDQPLREKMLQVFTRLTEAMARSGGAA